MLHKIMKFWGILVIAIIAIGIIGMLFEVLKMMWLDSPLTVLIIIFIFPPIVYFWLKRGS